jgi:hypothetical protein
LKKISWSEVIQQIPPQPKNINVPKEDDHIEESAKDEKPPYNDIASLMEVMLQNMNLKMGGTSPEFEKYNDIDLTGKP